MTSKPNNSALDFAKRGWFVFPLSPGTRIPYADFSWTQESSDSPEDIAQWQKDFPGCNWGLDCGKSGLTVVDLDVKNGKDGITNFYDLEKRLGVPDYTALEVRTTTGGIHLYFEGLSSTSASRIADGVDTRSTGGYVVLPGSRINGDKYEILKDVPSLPKLPEILKSTIGVKKEREIKLDAVIDLDQPANVIDAMAYLQTAPPSIEGVGGDENAYRVACRVRDLGITDTTALDLMLRFWNERCQPSWDFGELKTKVDNAYQYAESPAGNGTAEGQFSAVVLPKKDILENDRPKRLSEFVGQPEERDWIVQDWLPTGEISSLYGAGGVGKSLLALQLAMAVASGGKFCGIQVSEQMPVLAVMAEDSDDELHRRTHAIRGIPEYAFKDEDIPLYLWSRAGKDAMIANVSSTDAKITLTEFSAKLDAFLSEMGEGRKLLILDTATDIFGGNENDRQVVNRFVKVVLGGIATAHNATILFLAHPSKSGEADGSHYSGSTAWNNSVRNRLVLKHHQLVELKDMRVLERAKSNYATTGAQISLQWERGAFKVITNDVEMADDIQSSDDKAVYDAIKAQSDLGKPVSMRGNGTNPIMNKVIKSSSGRVLKFNELKIIVRRLQMQNHIVLVSGQRSGKNGLWPTEDKIAHEKAGLFSPVKIEMEPEEEEPEKEGDLEWL